jgi:amino acid transporter
VICSMAVVFMGGAVEIYTFSNVGYLASFIPVLIGYFLLRKYRPNVRRPFKLPEWMKYAALALAGVYALIYFWGGPLYANCTCNAAGRKTLVYYFIGFAVLATYYPLYRWRKASDRRSEGVPPPEPGLAPVGLTAPGPEEVPPAV